ncbi:MAG TPA: prepilin-type N-terminal cleavage/methylation domain-containing protein [Candidatus Solibacter sp.]|jgi:prepilin-type N-terminal cleavage/methylation domain-containing protein|nr:prepilin-type N-terminal cleavage/methylation domain-containing protein [Candidatus Solibacter sp.]
MEASLSHRKAGRASGFTLIETLLAMFIMAMGMLGVAALMSQMSGTSVQSRYMSTEALLASEKIEDLNRYGASDTNVAAGGSLTADTAGYFDQIQASAGQDASASGDIVETSTGIDPVTAAANYTITKHSPNGTASSKTIVGTPPAATPDMAVFNRRWLIEANTPVNGVRRITVLVTLTTATQGQQATFQMSTVRP